MGKHLPFIVILILAAAARFTILCVSQTHVNSDEAIIGLMGKHILEGRSHPFYMYGQPYNAGAAWEAYLAAMAFAIFGVGVIPLKGCIVVLSLVCLVLFYRMALRLHEQQTAILSTLLFALSPSLLKWHFQVRGYSWYFISIPVLTILFLSVTSCDAPKTRKVFLFGLASGLSVWCLELVLSLNAALWILLGLRRKLSLRKAMAGAAGFIAGYAPVIAFNLTHNGVNWQYLLMKTGGGNLPPLFHFSTFTNIFFQEMPKFFGPDTILWYYPEKPLIGYVFYAIALGAVGAALWPFLRTPSKIPSALSGDLAGSDKNKDLLMVILAAACFVPYLIAPVRVPGYFLGGCFFLSILAGRLLKRCFAASAALPRFVGAAILLAAGGGGIDAMITMGMQNQIETLTLNQPEKHLRMTRVPGVDIEGVEHYLRQNQISSVWTTVSFVYPLVFESDEKLAVSSAIFGYEYRCYPRTIPWREPDPNQRAVFVIETHSPYRPAVEAWCARRGGVPPLVTEYGTLTVIEEKLQPNHAQ